MNQTSLGQLLFIGIKKTEIDAETKELLSSLQPGGIILFKRNIESADQLQHLIQHINSLCTIKPFIAVDQEGGSVQRLQGILPFIPPPLTLASTYSISAIKQINRTIAQLLAHLGINLNLYPVLDILYTNKNSTLGDRCLSSDPKKIYTNALAIIQEYKKTGIYCCGKHFPGLGCTEIDSHESLPVCSLTKKQLWEKDLLPYRLLAKKLPFIMIAHCSYPSLASNQISSLSPLIITNLLIQTLHFKGIIITDDLEMGAISRTIEPEHAALNALLAGCHCAMLCHTYDHMHTTLTHVHKEYHSNTTIQENLQNKIHTLLSCKQTLTNASTKKQLPPFNKLHQHLITLLE